MCTGIETALLIASVASSAVSVAGQYQSAKAQVKAIDQQNEVQAKQIAQQAGQQISERARMARRERASARAAASEAGVNLGSGSFLAALQTSAMNQYTDNGLISQNERGQQEARAAQASSMMSQIQMPTALSAALTIGTTGLSAYSGIKGSQDAGISAATGSRAPDLTGGVGMPTNPIDAAVKRLSQPFGGT